MSYARSPKEDDFVNTYLKREIQALGVDADIRGKFIGFAVHEGSADPKRFPPRLYHVIKGRTPSAYIATLIIKFFSERLFEDFSRQTKNYVEYITTGRDTTDLEKFVEAHPLALRIVRVRLTDSPSEGEPTSLQVHLRSPIKKPDYPIDNEKKSTDILNSRNAEFYLWLHHQGTVPVAFKTKSSKRIKIHYLPDWLYGGDPSGFEWDSNLHGSVDISEGIRILLYAHLGAGAPFLPHGLDTFYHLSQILEGSKAKPAPEGTVFMDYWPRIVESGSNFQEIFFRHLDDFSLSDRNDLIDFFAKFSNQHPTWVRKAMSDWDTIGEKLEEHSPTPADVLHYEEVKKVFFRELKPILEHHWQTIADTCLIILEKERRRAQQHYRRMRKYFHA